MVTTSPASQGQERSFYQANAMQKPATVNTKQLQQPVKENITELQNKRNNLTKEISLYKVEVQDGAKYMPLHRKRDSNFSQYCNRRSTQMTLSCHIWSFIAENIKQSPDTEAMLYCQFFHFHFASYTHEFQLGRKFSLLLKRKINK